MTEKELRTQLSKCGVDKDTLDVRMYVPSADELVYIQVGDGSQLEPGDCDENGKLCDGYLDFMQYSWDGAELSEVDGGLCMYCTGEEDDRLGEMITRMYKTLALIYGEEVVSTEGFQVQILARQII